MKGKNVFSAFCMFIVSIVCASSLVAEIRVFEKEVEEIVGRGQSQEQVESFALQKAKRLAVEEAGTYISSLTVVRNFQLEKEEINALASGVVQTKVIGIPSVEIKSGVVHVKVKAVIQVDTTILDKQIAEIMKEKGTLKKLEEEQRKVKQLENQLASLKNTELKRLDELNAQALALEREQANYPSQPTAGGKESKDPVTGMEFVYIKGGCFDMGDTFGDGYDNEKPVHKVCLSDFYMGKYEVTQGQWKAIMGSNPSHFKNCGDTCPVETVSWDDTQKFIQKLNNRTGKSFRLPAEAEWEYAARSGGKKEKYAGASSDSDLGNYAWYDSNSGGKTHPVGHKQPNSLGLYDMAGNVWEWVSDRYYGNHYKSSIRDNPRGPSSGSTRVLRGGCWSRRPRSVRASYRGNFNPSYRADNFGLRVVSSPE